MKTDSLGRRRRDLRQPLKEHVYQVTERDIAWLSFIHRHAGRLPTTHLYEATADTHRNFTKAQHRLNTLFQELKFLKRPQFQFDANGRHYYHEMIYELSQVGIEQLKNRGLHSEYAPSLQGAKDHQLLLSCLSASFELSARKHGYSYTPQHEILEAVGHGLTINLAEEEEPKDEITPDEVFMLSHGDQKLLLFLEVDRGTEPLTSKQNRKTWERNVRQYISLIREKKYKELFGVNCAAMLLIVSPSAERNESILKMVGKQLGKKCSFILTHHVPEFACAFYLPKPMDVLAIPWLRYGDKKPYTFL